MYIEACDAPEVSSPLVHSWPNSLNVSNCSQLVSNKSAHHKHCSVVCLSTMHA